MVDCARASIQDVADAAGLDLQIDSDAPVPLAAEFSDYCFGQRATNASMWLGAGLDLVIEDVHIDPVELPLILRGFPVIGMLRTSEQQFTLYVRFPLTPILAAESIPQFVRDIAEGYGLPSEGDEEISAGEVVIYLAQDQGQVTLTPEMKAQYRLDMAGLADYLEDRARSDPDGTDAAEGIPGVVGVSDSASSQYLHDPPADYVEPPLPYQPSFTLEPSIATDEDRADAIARAYNLGFAAEWCEATTADNLESLKVTTEGALCDVCGDFAGRHLRFGTGEADYDADVVPLCELLGTSTFVYLDMDVPDGLSWDEVGQIWCGCREPPGEGEETDEEESTGCSGTFSGRIVDALTLEPVVDATIEYSSSELIASDGSGNYESPALDCGSYPLHIEAPGYLAADLAIELAEDGVSVQVIELHAVDEACESELTSISGLILDGFTGLPVVGATVELREGPGALASDLPVEIAETDEDGLYLFEDQVGGYYTLHVAADGYESGAPREVAVCGESEGERDIHLIPNAEQGVSFVLNWARPSDLDLHLLLPDGDEVAFGECAGALEGEPFARFEVDHLNADGPESIRLSDTLAGVYTLYVHNFAAQNNGEQSFAGSEAEVTVYEDSVAIQSYQVPTSGSGFFWDVLEFEGPLDSLEIRTLGRLTNSRANPLGEGEYSATCTPVGP